MSRDTTASARAAQTALYQAMSPARRGEIAASMSSAARQITLSGIHRRHPKYDARSARLALFPLLVGDELFRRAWPNAPLLDP